MHEPISAPKKKLLEIDRMGLFTSLKKLLEIDYNQYTQKKPILGTSGHKITKEIIPLEKSNANI